MKFIEVILTDGDKVLVNINHITMLEPNDEECVITVSSGEFLNVNQTYKSVKDDIKNSLRNKKVVYPREMDIL